MKVASALRDPGAKRVRNTTGQKVRCSELDPAIEKGHEQHAGQHSEWRLPHKRIGERAARSPHARRCPYGGGAAEGEGEGGAGGGEGGGGEGGGERGVAARVNDEGGDERVAIVPAARRRSSVVASPRAPLSASTAVAHAAARVFGQLQTTIAHE